MMNLRCTLHHQDGRISPVDVAVQEGPSEWDAEDARHFLWHLLRLLKVHSVYRMVLTPGSSTVEWAVEADTDLGKVVTQPLALSSGARHWYETWRFLTPESWPSL
jgi:hypothetical protein